MIVICLAGEHARSARFIIWDLITIPLEMFNVAELPPHLCRVDFVRNLSVAEPGTEPAATHPERKSLKVHPCAGYCGRDLADFLDS